MSRCLAGRVMAALRLDDEGGGDEFDQRPEETARDRHFTIGIEGESGQPFVDVRLLLST